MKTPLRMRVSGSPFRLDWTDLKAVIKYANRLGPGNVVVKYPDRNNYNITHDGKRLEYLKIVYNIEVIHYGQSEVNT